MAINDVRAALELRTRLEDRLKAMNVPIPPRLPWDDTGELRNMQLIQEIERHEERLGLRGQRP